MNGPKDVSWNYLAMGCDWYAAECANQGLQRGGTPDRHTPTLAAVIFLFLLLCSIMGFRLL